MIGHDVLQILPEFQRQALTLMADQATITRPGGTDTFDPNTGVLTPAAGSVVYTGRCRMMQPSAQGVTTQFGEQQVTESKYVACFPADCADAQIGDLITFTESADPDVLDRSFRITAVPASTFVVYKGYPCESVET